MFESNRDVNRPPPSSRCDLKRRLTKERQSILGDSPLKLIFFSKWSFRGGGRGWGRIKEVSDNQLRAQWGAKPSPALILKGLSHEMRNSPIVALLLVKLWYSWCYRSEQFYCIRIHNSDMEPDSDLCCTCSSKS